MRLYIILLFSFLYEIRIQGKYVCVDNQIKVNSSLLSPGKNSCEGSNRDDRVAVGEEKNWQLCDLEWDRELGEGEGVRVQMWE